ncbi:phenoloxidase-activating factor 2-like [Condylostylus longicornis]|uniref:phenoloxidase-activating factor 2-like n=1 Tax=Condylostylus longicornis TaxID=2530218 RepID=UPI00244E2A32|nr:phenoloxidase-activating factor 2-like [Condylostylus longicornis]
MKSSVNFIMLMLISILVGTINTNKIPSNILDNVKAGMIERDSTRLKKRSENDEAYHPSYLPCEDNGQCVPFYHCKNKNNYNIDGKMLIDIRFDEAKSCKSYLEICCKNDSHIIIDENIFNEKHINNIRNHCGVGNQNGIYFKLSGNNANEAEYGEFPWMIAVLKRTEIESSIYNTYHCGGSLIHPHVVLTAAHCVYKNSAHELIARAGEWDTQTNDEIYKEQDRYINEIIVHEKFIIDTYFNDIALLITVDQFNLGVDVNTICLPPKEINFDNARCFATGWGKDQFGKEGKYQVILKKIDIPVVPNNKCQESLRKTRFGERFILHDSFICAGGELGKDTCKGDGGGPLNCPIPEQSGRYYEAGIISWGIGCGGTNPGVYSSITYLRDWIDNIMEMKNYDKFYYIAY